MLVNIFNPIKGYQCECNGTEWKRNDINLDDKRGVNLSILSLVEMLQFLLGNWKYGFCYLKNHWRIKDLKKLWLSTYQARDLTWGTFML